MNSRLKELAVAVVAILVIGAWAATQGATAAPWTIESENETVYITQKHESPFRFWISAGGEVICEEATLAGSGIGKKSVNEVTSTLNLPTEKSGGGNNCTAFGFAGAHVKSNGCTAQLTTATAVSVGIVTWGKEQVHIVCPTGMTIEITPTVFGASVCTQFVASQTPTGGHITGRNDIPSSPMNTTVEYTLKELHSTGTGSSCGNSETHSDGEMRGSFKAKCYSDAGHTKQIGCTFS